MTEEKRVAVVTGGERGIGRGITDRLLADGYCVVIANRNEADGQQAVAEVNHHALKDVACEQTPF